MGSAFMAGIEASSPFSRPQRRSPIMKDSYAAGVARAGILDHLLSERGGSAVRNIFQHPMLHNFRAES